MRNFIKLLCICCLLIGIFILLFVAYTEYYNYKCRQKYGPTDVYKVDNGLDVCLNGAGEVRPLY